MKLLREWRISNLKRRNKLKAILKSTRCNGLSKDSMPWKCLMRENSLLLKG
jgi:hypothetical protein